jgi:hypothetical protein
LSSDLVEQRFVQRLSDERFTEPDERRALGCGFARREAAIATKRRPVLQRLRKLHVRQIAPHRKQHRFEQRQRRPRRLALGGTGDDGQLALDRSPVDQVAQIVQ